MWIYYINQNIFDSKKKLFETSFQQDITYYYINNVLCHSTIFSTSSNKLKREISLKASEDIQLSVIIIGSFISLFYASWKVSVIILFLPPLIAATEYLV